MNTISAIIEPHEDGTLHLPLPEAWRHRAIRVKAELEPVEACLERPEDSSSDSLGIFRKLKQAAAMTAEGAIAWKEAVVEARR